MRTLLLSILFILPPAAGPAQAASPTDVLADCSSPAFQGVLCGELAVPEDRDRPGGRELSLYVSVLPALTESDALPLVILEGGPGAALSTNMGMYAVSFGAVRQHRDLVFIDLRGTGRSAPMPCDSITTLESVTACAAKLSETNDPRAFHTAAVVADLEAVREWLGYPRWNLFAVSYGTRAALLYAKSHPDRIASAALLAPYPLDRNVALEAGRIADASLTGVITACAADEECSAAYPDLAHAVEQLGRSLAEHESVGDVSATTFTSTLRLALFGSPATSRVPQLLSRAAAGDLEPFAQLRSALEGQTTAWISQGTLLSTLCAEDFSRAEPEAMMAGGQGTFFGAWWAIALNEACSAWPHHQPDASFWQPLSGPTPLLLLAGGLDPAMDPQWAHEIAARNPNAQVALIPEAQHSLIGLSSVFCALGLVQRFLDDPLTTLDTSCVETMARPPFTLPN